MPQTPKRPSHIMARQRLLRLRRENGRSDRIRTYDPLVPNEVRYQTALHSDTDISSGKAGLIAAVAKGRKGRFASPGRYLSKNDSRKTGLPGRPSPIMYTPTIGA